MNNDNQFNIFDGIVWKNRIYDTYLAYKSISFFLNYAVNSGNEALEEEIESLEKAFDLKIKQMIVLFCTYTEVMIKDFFYTIYCEHPEEIKIFLPEKFSDHFDALLLENLLTTDSIKIFANISAKKSFDFDMNVVFRNICKTLHKTNQKKCKDNFKKIIEHFIEIFKIRNALIHENKVLHKNLEDVIETSYLHIAPKFIEELDKFCDSLNIQSVKEIKQKRKDKFDLFFNDSTS